MDKNRLKTKEKNTQHQFFKNEKKIKKMFGWAQQIRAAHLRLPHASPPCFDASGHHRWDRSFLWMSYFEHQMVVQKLTISFSSDWLIGMQVDVSAESVLVISALARKLQQQRLVHLGPARTDTDTRRACPPASLLIKHGYVLVIFLQKKCYPIQHRRDILSVSQNLTLWQDIQVELEKCGCTKKNLLREDKFIKSYIVFYSINYY